MPEFFTGMTDQASRDRAEMGVLDFLPEEMPDRFVDVAVAYALDDFDAEQESDGTWHDCTPYEDCARRAIEEWHEAMEAAHLDRGDYLLGLHTGN